MLSVTIQHESLPQVINAWRTAAGIEDGRLLRSVSKSGKVNRDALSDWAVRFPLHDEHMEATPRVCE